MGRYRNPDSRGWESLKQDRPLTPSEIQEIKPGSKVTYLAGHGIHRCEAYAEIVEAGVTARIRITKIISQGDESHRYEGEVIIAGHYELRLF